MASVLFISRHLDCAPLAFKLADEGHLVKVYVYGNEKYKFEKAFRGFKNPSLAKTWRNFKQYDLVLSDMVGTGTLMERIRQGGGLVLGGGLFNDKLELDRAYGEKVASSLTKVEVPGGVEITSVEALKQYLKEVGKPVVVKPEGNKPVNLSLVSQDEENTYLLSVVERYGNELVPCVVQDKVDGIEISTEGWFNGEKFVCFNHTIEKKRLHEGDKGPNTGCMGNVVWVCEEDKLVQTALLPLEPLLKKVNYVGPLDVNCIVTEDKAYFLEYTARFGYDAIQALCELIPGSVFDFLFRVTTQWDGKFDFIDEYSLAIRLVMHPYPAEEGAEALEGLEVLRVPKEAKKHVWLSDVYKEGDSYRLLGTDGVIGCVTARGTSIRECKRRVFRTIDNITLTPEVVYRRDIPEGVEEKIQQLRDWGWIN